MKLKITDRDALIIVDMQNDFMPNGVLPVPEGDKIIPTLNQYIQKFEEKGQPIFFTRDWHPVDHISFRGHGGIWPKHCVMNTEGAKFHKDLKIPADNKFIISKGTNKEFDAYSGFQGTILNELLKERGIKRLLIGGVATDYCVKNTALGGINLGYQVFILQDGIKGVDINVGDSQRAIDLLLNKGATLITLEDIT